MKIERSLVVFLLSGSIAFAVDASVTMIAYSVTGSLIVSRCFGFLLAVLTTWLINRTFGFRTGYKPPLELFREFIAYLTLMGGGAIMNLIVYSIFVKNVRPDSLVGLFPPVIPAQKLIIISGIALGTLFGLILNYLSSRRVLSRKD